MFLEKKYSYEIVWIFFVHYFLFSSNLNIRKKFRVRKKVEEPIDFNWNSRPVYECDLLWNNNSLK